MQTIFHLQDGGSFPLASGFPAGYNNIILEGGIANYHQTTSELIILQQFERPDFVIQLGNFRFLRLVRSIFHPPPFAFGTLLALKGNLKISFPKISSFTLREGQFSLLRFGHENLFAEFKAAIEYQLLQISYSDHVIAQTLPLFNHLPRILQKTNEPTSFISPPRFADGKVQGLVQDLLHTPFTPEANEIYFDYRVREYLLLLLLESSKALETGIYLTNSEKDKLIAFAARLREDAQGKYPIAVVAKEMGMNEMKLKVAFKQIFGKSIFEYHTDQRMKVAHRLLEESGLPTKVIAKMVGYELVSSFITKFREYFHYPPGRIQKKF